MEIKFYGKLTEIGNSRGVIVPKAICELLEPKKYLFVIKEVNDGEETSTPNDR